MLVAGEMRYQKNKIGISFYILFFSEPTSFSAFTFILLVILVCCTHFFSFFGLASWNAWTFTINSQVKKRERRGKTDEENV